MDIIWSATAFGTPIEIRPARPMLLKNLLAKTGITIQSYRRRTSNHCPMTIDRARSHGRHAEARADYAFAYLGGWSWHRRRATRSMPRTGGSGSARKPPMPTTSASSAARSGALNARATLRAYLPDLAPGLGAAAFHAAIRTGLWRDRRGFRTRSPSGSPIGRRATLALPERADHAGGTALRPSDDPLQILKKTRTWPGLDFEPDADALIDREMLRAADPTLFPLFAAALEIDDLTLDRLRQAAALLFLGVERLQQPARGDGFACGANPERFRGRPPRLCARSWRALLALYLSLDRLELPTPAAAADFDRGRPAGLECDPAGCCRRRRRARDQAGLLLPRREPWPAVAARSSRYARWRVQGRRLLSTPTANAPRRRRTAHPTRMSAPDAAAGR